MPVIMSHAKAGSTALRVPAADHAGGRVRRLGRRRTFRQAPPAEGARFDFYLEGPVSGPKLQGTFRGIDYICFRADGRAELHIHGEITTADGKKIALEAGGVAIAEEASPVFQLREHVSLMSNHPELSWVNPIEVWARGVVDVSTGQVHVTAYAV